MNPSLPEVCRQLLAFHVLLGSSILTDERRDELRRELANLLAAHGLKWTDWPEFFSRQNIQSTQALPPVDSSKWKKHCQKICQLHAMMGSVDEDGSVAHKKLLAEITKQKFSWPSDLPAILAAHWNFKNPPNFDSAAAAPSDAPEIDVFKLTRAVVDDRIVMKPTASIVTTLIVLCTHVYDQFARIPQFGAIAPTSGRGKTTLMKEVLARLVADPWYSSSTTAPAIYRYLYRHPRATVMLDERENQKFDSDLWALIDMAHEGGSKDLVIDGESVKITIRVPVFWAIRGDIHDVPLSILSRGFQISLEKGKPKIRMKRRIDLDPTYTDDLVIAHEEICKWAATCSLNYDPEIPAELDNDRLADICRPLLSIADYLGHGAEARAAVIQLCAARPPQDMGIQALQDAKIAFSALGIDRLDKKDLAKAIVVHGHPYWSYWRGPKDQKHPHELTPVELGALLGRFGIHPKNIWPAPRTPETKSIWGYHIEMFEKPWAEHCPEDSTSSQPGKIIALVKKF
jgi:hypothetical protein